MQPTITPLSFPAALAGTNVTDDMPFPSPCIKGDALSIKICQDEYHKGLEDCRKVLRARLTLNEGDKPYSAHVLSIKIGKIWKTTASWKMVLLDAETDSCITLDTFGRTTARILAGDLKEIASASIGHNSNTCKWLNPQAAKDKENRGKQHVKDNVAAPPKAPQSKDMGPSTSAIGGKGRGFRLYQKWIEIYEEIARQSLSNNLLKYGVEGYLLNAGICQLCKGDVVAITNALVRYQELDPTFSGTREYRLLAVYCL
ncbi:hypothetical protein MTR_6g003940 [Medicago truncatula]|uniref:Uncharacterized protein n=1 Tax=Medicago truncatula TaxID=3880 RepID=A0A072U6C4_MEDTR|nr:hypothetical protein MTR_6g003940 [Medicago truncatula]